MEYSFLAARLSFTFIYICIFFSWQINSSAALPPKEAGPILAYIMHNALGVLSVQVVESTSASGCQFSQTVSLEPDEQLVGDQSSPAGRPAAEPAKRDGHPSVAFSVSVEPPLRGPCILSLQAGQFETCTMPENVEQLWGPISLPSLPDGVPNTCVVASHRCVHHSVLH